ncbi:hypothetical protein [Skermania piniformis]|uniref:Transposase n=1 Tax=Skermania pinensis TaxID=39122 RepID=A0ABX8SBT1_9ACTN|nr:hypothetical protein [Skermania piniformis]QXQ14432.1 hypothetical protein KV203_03170 [Skermania piniformis]
MRTVAQNDGHTVRTIGARRFVAAFDPDHDDPELLRTLILLLRTAALAASVRTGGQLAAAEEKIALALDEVDKLDEVKKAAGAIQKSATKIESSCSGIHAGIHRLLAEATAAITDDTAAPSGDDQRRVA